MASDSTAIAQLSPEGSAFVDPHDAAIVQGIQDGSLLGLFNQASVLAPADVHVAITLARLAGEDDPVVSLGVALAVRAPRVGHVRVDLGTVRSTAAVEAAEDADIDGLPWPDPPDWVERLRLSSLVSCGFASDPRPLRLVGESLYLDRYWQDEQAVAGDLMHRASGASRPIAEGQLIEGLSRLFPTASSMEQRWAGAAAALGRLTVIAGGPGTGKTTTVARTIALLMEQALANKVQPPMVALAAPTGKAANRMQEAVRAEAEDLEVSEAVRELLRQVEASTLHRLLVNMPGSSSRFRHDSSNRLPHDVVVVDETSMVPLSLMARLLEAVRPDACLILAGDPEQLASVEAGAVLADIVGPAATGLRLGNERRQALAKMAGSVPPVASGARGGFGDGVIVLRANHRFEGAVAKLAEAVRAGDSDAVVQALRFGDETVQWVEADASDASERSLAPLRAEVTRAGEILTKAARDGDGGACLQALSGYRVLCAHRRGEAGVAVWNARIENWLIETVPGFVPDDNWYCGRPIIVTANDYGLRLYNGDTGVVVDRPDQGLLVACQRSGVLDYVSPSRLANVETIWAMTVHKAQGSEFEAVAVLLPEPNSRILSRELFYTALTRARRAVMVVGSEASVRAAVERRVARASGLAELLWPSSGPASASVS